MPQACSIPAGFHSAMPYLIFDGTAAEAIAFYCEAFGATELPGRLTDPAGRVLDAGIMIGDSVIRVGDEAPWRIAKSPQTLGGASSFVHLYLCRRCGRSDWAGCDPRRENPTAHQKISFTETAPEVLSIHSSRPGLSPAIKKIYLRKRSSGGLLLLFAVHKRA